MSQLVTFGFGQSNYLITGGFFEVEGDSTLTVETGTGLDLAADSYCSVDFADTYHDNRGNDAWALATTVQKDRALRKAVDVMTQRYRLRWLGQRVVYTQPLEWPRYNVSIPDSPGGYRGFASVIPYNIIPEQVKRAQAEYALRVIQGIDLNPDQQDAVKTKKVGPLEITYEFGSRAGQMFVAIDLLLQPLMSGGSYYRARRA